jgi:hypothetical protein
MNDWRDIPDIGLYLAAGDVLPETKMTICELITEDEQASLEARGKAWCHLAYRLIDGCYAEENLTNVTQGLLELRRAAEGFPIAIQRARWQVSAAMALAYCQILHPHHTKPGIMILEELTACRDAVRVHPACGVNFLRAQCLIAAHAIAINDKEKAEECINSIRLTFREAVAAINRWDPPQILAEEIRRMVAVLRIAELLREPTVQWDKVLAADPSQPFAETLKTLTRTQDD